MTMSGQPQRIGASRLVALNALALGVVACVIPFVYLHVTGDGVLFLVCAPLALVLAVASIVAGIRSRPRSPLAVVLGVALAGFSAYLIVGLVLFTLACSGTISGHC
jgi:hypothetical protein